MKATEILREKTIVGDLVVEMVIWQVPMPIPGSCHAYKYRLYCGRAGKCLVRYDNERGKGDHVHYDAGEFSYQFVSLAKLIDDFETDVARLTGGGL
ncbi:toxin-antitoxin system TumE family protein [Methylomagnum sp.]